MKVFVYYNLHKKCFSVKALEGHRKGLVIAHREALTLTKGHCKVSEAGRQRVIKEQRKNVHAGMVGEWNEKSSPVCDLNSMNELTYNPYKYKGFVEKNNPDKLVDKWELCYMENRRVWIK